MRVVTHRLDRLGIVNPYPFDKFHDEDTRRGIFPVDLRETDARDVPEVARHAVGIAAVTGEIKFLDDLVGEVLDHADRVVDSGLGKDGLDALGHRLQDADVGLDDLFYPRTLDLDGDPGPVLQDGPVDLPDRCGCDRGLVKLGKPVIEAYAALFDDRADFRERDGFCMILQFLELLDHLRRQQFGPRAHDLPELHECRAEFLECQAYPLVDGRGLGRLPASREPEPRTTRE